MPQSTDCAELDSDRLLQEWRWLCPHPLKVIARSAFGDLFLEDETGRVHMLDVGLGEFSLIAKSVSDFEEQAATLEMQEHWFAKKDEDSARARGLIPGPGQCIGFSTPLVFAEAGHPNPAYVIDLYENVGFLGNIHRQIADLPDGAKIRLVIQSHSSRS
jgi:hypothetical protein